MIRKHLDEQKDGDNVEYITLDAIDSLDAAMLPTKKELLTIVTGLYGDIVHKVQNIMTHLMVIRMDKSAQIPFDDKKTNSFYAIPTTMSNKNFFSLLSHLVIPGTSFTLRPSLIMAMIAYMSGNVLLQQRAKELLLEFKGKWISLDKLVEFPEFISVPFVKLAIRCNRAMSEQFLTEIENKFYTQMYTLYRVRQTRP